MPNASTVGNPWSELFHIQHDRQSIARDDKRHRHARVHAYDLLDVLEALDIGAVDIRDDIAGMDFTRFGRAARLDLANFWRGERLTVSREQDREDDDREDKIRDRSAGDNCGALPQSLAVERYGPFRRAQLVHPGDRQARTGIGIAKHLDVAAERDRAELPAGAGPVPPAEQFRPETDREHLDLHVIAPRNPVMAELVDKDEDRQNDHKPKGDPQKVVHPAL